MGEYEPNDSRNVTQTNKTAPGEPPRTGPREGETRVDSHKDGEGEKGVRAAPRTKDGGHPTAQPQQKTSQSQSQGGQRQSMGGMNQSQQGSASRDAAAPRPAGQAPASSSSPQSSAPTQSSGGNSAQQAEGGNSDGMNTPQEMQQSDPETERTRREQAAGQGEHDVPQFSAEEDPDAEERGYGGAGEERMKRIEKDR